MKNYKHSFKSNNAMKLAAVASAAIMMAPVALNTVSTFASAGEQTTTVGVTLVSAATRSALKDAIVNAKAQAAVPSKTTGFDIVDKLLAKKNATLNGQISKAEAALAGENFNNGTKFDYSKGLTEAAALDLIAILAEDINDAAQVTDAGTPVDSAAAFAAKADDLKAAAATAATEATKQATDATAKADATAAAKAAAKNAALDKQAAAQAAQKAAAKAKSAALAAAQKAVDSAQTLYDVLPAATKNSTKGNILLGALNAAKATVADGTDTAALTKVVTTLSDAVQNLFTTSTGNASTGTTGTIADTPNKSTQASDAASAAAKAAEAAKQAVIDALNQQIKGLEAEKTTTTNKSTIASINAQIVALNTRINALKGNTIASTPNKSTEASDAAKAAAKANSRKTGVLKVTYVKGYGIQVWTKDGKMVASDAKGAKAGDKKKLQDGTSWKVFGPSVNINGHNMYNVGGNQYVDTKYVSFTHSVDLAK